MSDIRSTLTLPSDPRLVRFARAYVAELAAAAELPDDGAAALAAAVAEMCATIFTHAFAPGEESSLSLHGSVTDVAVQLVIHERGLPFDPSAPASGGATAQADAGPPTEASVRAALAGGAALRGLLDAADHVRWHARGKAGMQLVIQTHRPHADVSGHLSPDSLAPYHEEVPQAPPQDYTIRRMRPEEAVQVAACMYRAYGYTYANPDLYYPARLVHLNETGRLVSLVAVDAAGEVVGHLGLERELDGVVAESGQAVVNPAHRGRHLLERLRAALDAEAAALGLHGVHGDAVTAHTFSQRMEESTGGRLCGIYLASIPRTAQFKAIDEGSHERISTVLYFKALQPLAPATVYPPPHHRAVLERLYAGLGAPVTFAEGTPPARAGHADLRYDRAWGVGYIRVRETGADTAALIAQDRHDLQTLARVAAVYLELPLSDPGTPALCAAAEAAGFFFCGLGPGFAQGSDVLVLQALNVPLDTDRLAIFSDAAKELLAYIAAERARVATLAGSA